MLISPISVFQFRTTHGQCSTSSSKTLMTWEETLNDEQLSM